jgi:hypothetical protein
VQGGRLQPGGLAGALSLLGLGFAILVQGLIPGTGRSLGRPLRFIATVMSYIQYALDGCQPPRLSGAAYAQHAAPCSRQWVWLSSMQATRAMCVTA